jgi:hypothetical protein
MINNFCSDLNWWACRKNTASILLQSKTLLLAVMLSVLGTQWASAACGSSSQRLLPNVVAGQALTLPQESVAGDSTLDREHPSSDKRPSITGLWKTVYTSGGNGR